MDTTQDFTVSMIPAGPEHPSQEPRTLYTGCYDDALAYYQDARDEGDGSGRALVLAGPDGRVVYACS